MDKISKKKRSENMSKIRSKDTLPEMKVRRFLFSKGLRYRLHVMKLPGRPDIVLQKHKMAIQVRGCFWHGHKCKIGHYPKSNRSFWRKKIDNNKLRDKKNDRRLINLGYCLVIIRECELAGRDYKSKIISKLKGWLGASCILSI